MPYVKRRLVAETFPAGTRACEVYVSVVKVGTSGQIDVTEGHRPSVITYNKMDVPDFFKPRIRWRRFYCECMGC